MPDPFHGGVETNRPQDIGPEGFGTHPCYGHLDVTSNVQVASSVMRSTACNDRIIMNLVTRLKWGPNVLPFYKS